MSPLKVTKFNVCHPMLKQLIKYYWVMEGDERTVVNHKLLPVNNFDIILSFSSPISYIWEDGPETVAAKAHFNGVKDKYLTINQTGRFDVIGISFFPSGLYPFVKVPLSEFRNRIIDLNLLINRFAEKAEERIRSAASISEKLHIIERLLLDMLNVEFIPDSRTLSLFDAFLADAEQQNIGMFCESCGINQRTLERSFNKYIGMSPILYHRLSRYQKAVNYMLHNRIVDFTGLSCELNYYDQNHFIKEFKGFTGCTPSKFFEDKKPVKDIITNA